MSAVQELISAIEGIQDWGGTYVGECIEAVEAEGIVTESMAAYVRKLEEEGKNLRARLQTAEQQLGQVTKELESVQQDLYETNESYEKAAHDRDVGVKDCRRLVTELGQVREEVKELRAVFAHSDDALLSAYNEGYATAQGSSGDANMERKHLDHWKQCRDKALSATPSDGCGKGRTDKERLDKLQELANDTPGITVGGVCSWSVYRGEERLGEGDDLREALDDAIENEAASSKGKGGCGMSEVYTSGIGYNKRYWIAVKRTAHFITFQRLRWSEDVMKERGVMYPTTETVRLKDGKHLWKRGYGFFSKHDDPSNPVEVRQPPTPPHDQS